MPGIETDEIINNILESFLTNYQEALGNKTTGSDFAFDYVEGLTYLYLKISLNSGGSFIDSPD